jgi:hypothetical protein
VIKIEKERKREREKERKREREKERKRARPPELGFFWLGNRNAQDLAHMIIQRNKLTGRNFSENFSNNFCAAVTQREYSMHIRVWATQKTRKHVYWPSPNLEQ